MFNRQMRKALPLPLLLFWLALTCAPVAAQTTATEKAVARAHSDAQLTWSPCPPIFAKGCEVVVLQGDPAKGRSDVFLRTPANYTLPSHWHTSPEHMVLVAGEMHVTYEGQETVVLKPGSYAYGPAKAKHKAHCAGGGPCVLFIAFESPIDAVLSESPAK